jgi:hypothetical protein
MWTLAAMNSIASTSHPTVSLTPPPMDVLMVSGFLGSILTLLFWMHQRESKSCVIALAVCLAGMAIFGFLQGAWPLAIMESVWSVATFRRSRQKEMIHKPNMRFLWLMTESRPRQWESQSRISRMFG